MKITMLLLLFSCLLTAGEPSTLINPPFAHSWGIHRGTEERLDMLLGNATDFDNPQGIACVKLMSWDDPKSSNDDDELTVFGVNSGRDEIIYNRSMKKLGLYRGKGDGALLHPLGIAANRKGDVLVADAGHNRVAHLFIKKDKLEYKGSIGSGELVSPFDVKITPRDTIFVTDSTGIHIYDINGQHLALIGQGKLISPRGLDIDNAAIKYSRYRENIIYVIDSLGKRITKMDYRGRILSRTRFADFGYSDGEASYLSLDVDDNLYIPDIKNCKVHKLDRNLDYIVSEGECGTKDYQFEQPRGIDIWRRFGQTFISEAHGAQYFWLGVGLSSLDIANRPDTGVVFDFYITQKAYITVEVDGPDGYHRLVYDKKRLDEGRRRLIWGIDGVPHGEYEILFRVEPTYSSYTYFSIERKRKLKL